MECGVLGRSGSHVQPHVAKGREREFVPAIHLHLKMVVSPALEMRTNMTPVTLSHAQVKMQNEAC